MDGGIGRCSTDVTSVVVVSYNLLICINNFSIILDGFHTFVWIRKSSVALHFGPKNTGDWFLFANLNSGKRMSPEF